MNRHQLFAAARREIEARRQRAHTRAGQQASKIHAQVPQLATLEAQQAQLGALAARLAADGRAQEAQQKIAELEGVRQRRALLLQQHGYSLASLLPQYSCPLCEDTGQKDGHMCECLLGEVKRMRREEINQSGPFFSSRFETFDVNRYPESQPEGGVGPRSHMQNILQDCIAYANTFGPKSQSLLLYGNAGLGKTHLALAIAGKVLEAGWDVIYVSAQNAFSQMSQNRYSGENELFASMLEADLLILDDLGTEYLDAYVLSRLYELVNGRMYRRPTIYTTNISSQEMFNQRYTEKISSRLLGDCHPMRFIGKDLRLNKPAP